MISLLKVLYLQQFHYFIAQVIDHLYNETVAESVSENVGESELHQA
jgi:hypothetical protein